MKKKIKIGIDIDNVIADTGSLHLDRFNAEFGTVIGYHEIKTFTFLDKYEGVDAEKLQTFTRTELEKDEFFLSIDPYQEAKNTISRWSKVGHAIHYITARPKAMERVTRAWLGKHGFLLPSVTVDLYDERIHEKEGGYKNVIAGRIGLDVMIEDDPDYARAIRVPVLLLDRPWNQDALPKHVRRVKDWGEIEKIVEKISHD